MKDEWLKKTKCNNLSNYPRRKLKYLPKPFDNPDLVVFEGVYEYPFCKIYYEVLNKRIPYIVIPRSALTKQARNKKKIKKIIGNIIFFNGFLKRAKAIQYLTTNELDESGTNWNKNSIIIPNGIGFKDRKKMKNNSKQLQGIFIGRIDTYQKGLDLLVEACEQIREELINSNVVLKLYGPDRYSSKRSLQKLIIEKQLHGVLSIHDAVFDDEKEKIQLESDFFIMTSRFEGHSMGLIEALSYGLPCLVTEGTNMKEEIQGSNAGWVADNNVQSIKLALLHVISEKNKLREKSLAAKELVRKYDWLMIGEMTTVKYKELVNKLDPK
nr:glycosyltransferase [Evansella tamaricis]